MKISSIILLILICCHCSFSQEKEKKPTESEKNTGSNIDWCFEKKYKYPFYGPHVPPYIALQIGYDGFNSSFLEAGLAFNIGHICVSSSTGAIVGGSTSYKRHFSNNIEGIETEIGFYSVVSMGVNINYTYTEKFSTIGVKPFIGVSLYHFQLLWGYNFFSDKKNGIENLPHSSFKLRYTIPLINIDKEKKKLQKRNHR
ncbi:MAG: hypothetical protein K9H64_00445 [Bacteroidales bacterium]|nr:hypothetical protein [Bacteroidales bacterium]MCF8454363.1 hypothetical protein [Bacteroidales bacterium]